MKIKTIFAAAVLCLSFCLCGSTAEAAESREEEFQKNYIQRLYHSEQGVDGSSANCIYAAQNGLLWIGSYTGLYSYDSSEFVSYEITDYAISVNAITQDPNGTIWVGTNGNGLYYYDGETFHPCPIDSKENMAYTIKELCVDAEGNLWAATKLGVFVVDTSAEEKKAVSAAEDLQEEIRDICILSNGEIALISRLGNLYFLDAERNLLKAEIPKLEEGVRVRCVADTETGDMYLGTNGKQILHLGADGEWKNTIETTGIESINQIYAIGEDLYWVCSDSGIGLMEKDVLTAMDYELNNSVESVCVDYQGNYWFSSSRQGVMQLYENYFSNLGEYLNYDQTVNSIEPYEDKLYIGSDSGLSCYRGKEPVTDDPLVKACENRRIRQIHADSDRNLWIVTYRMGLIKISPDGKITVLDSSNSGFTTNAMRCIYECRDGRFLVGSEEGAFVLHTDGKAERLVENSPINENRILSAAEDNEGRIYLGTDGDGIYVIENGQIVRRITMQEGLLSNVILKLRTGVNLDGMWVVTGAGVSFVDPEYQLSNVTGINYANSLDLVFLNEKEVAILAGNGFFRIKEEELLNDEIICMHYDKQLGLPVDFTANANNIVRDGILYMCGTDGIASLDLDKQPLQRDIRIYIKEIQGDQKKYFPADQNVTIDADTHRLNLDVRVLNYSRGEYDISFMLEGTDKKASRIDSSNQQVISYTNLRGGEYHYQYQVMEKRTDQVLAEESIHIKKEYHMWETPYVIFLVVILILSIIGLIIYLLLIHKDKEISERYSRKFRKEHEKEIEKLAFQDLETGLFNRNSYEQARNSVEMDKLYAVSTVSINHAEYLKNKYGMLYYGNILKKTARILQEHTGEKTQIYRLSDYIFCVWFEEPVKLENYILQIKEAFKELWTEEEEDASTLAVGAVYHDRLLQEEYESLVKACEEMRLLDQKHEEMKFIDRKINYMKLS
ncbi:MAG: two-component regulator propeller domain-containing protein [Eubacteriales bacterium]|nr:two-component regulator propeller domain-containing protein [Eubacteriales bacterium]